MDIYFLDVVDVVPARSAGGLDYSFYLVVAATILAEGAIMWWMKYNPLGRSLLHSFLANAASLAAGFLLYEVVPGLFLPFVLLNLAAMLLITIAVELPVLYLLNKRQVFRFTLSVCAMMNVISYLLFYLYISIFAK